MRRDFSFYFVAAFKKLFLRFLESAIQLIQGKKGPGIGSGILELVTSLIHLNNMNKKFQTLEDSKLQNFLC